MVTHRRVRAAQPAAAAARTRTSRDRSHAAYQFTSHFTSLHYALLTFVLRWNCTSDLANMGIFELVESQPETKHDITFII